MEYRHKIEFSLPEIEKTFPAKIQNYMYEYTLDVSVFVQT